MRMTDSSSAQRGFYILWWWWWGGALEIVSRLMDRWNGITRQTHLLLTVWLRLLEKDTKTQCV